MNNAQGQQENVAAIALAGIAADKPTLIPDEDSKNQKKESTSTKRGKPDLEAVKLPEDLPVIQITNKPRTHANHTYRDFSRVPKEMSDVFPEKIQDMTFNQKVFHILSRGDEFGKWITWMPHGRSFRVIVPVMFEKKISEEYFGHKRFSSFLRQLSNHGYKHVTAGSDRNCYYHECMLRGLPHALKFMPKPKDARRQIPDPENEPNFYQISKTFPLPDDPNFNQEQAPVAKTRPASVAFPSLGIEPPMKRQATMMPPPVALNPHQQLLQQLAASRLQQQQPTLPHMLSTLQQLQRNNNHLLTAATLQSSLALSNAPGFSNSAPLQDKSMLVQLLLRQMQSNGH